MKSSGFALIVVLSLAFISPAMADRMADQLSPCVGQASVDALFTDGVPLPYQAQEVRAINSETGLAGFYALMTNPETGSKVVLLDIRQVRRDSRYITSSLGMLTTELLSFYRGENAATIRTTPVESSSPNHALADLRIASPDGQVESGFIGRLKTSKNRYIILLLTASSGNRLSKGSPLPSLREEANDLMRHVRSTDKPLPSERYILWRLRQIFH